VEIALIILSVLGIVGALYLLRAILLPLILAIMASYLLAPIMRGLRHIQIPAALSAAIILVTGIAVVAALVSMLSAPASDFVTHAPEGLHRLQQKLSPLKKPIEKFALATGEVEKIMQPPSQNIASVEVKHGELAKELFGETTDLAARALTMIVLLYFLLTYSGFFLGKMVKVIPRLSDKKKAIQITDQVEKKISRYLFTITLINSGLGLAVGLAAYFLKLPNPLLWAVAACILNFIPYLGALVGMTCMTLAALLSFDNLAHILACPGAYLAIAVLEGNFITPSLLGRSLTLNPVIILVSLMFWGWMWGIAGMILAVPILAVFKIICQQLPNLSALGEFLGD
jgi:predicted PurR-regulated permease PerM